MATALELSLVEFDSALRRIRGDLAHADVAGLGGSAVERDRSAALRASTYVWTAAALERYVRAALQYVLMELNALGAPHSHIRTSLFALLGDALVEQVRARGRRKSWPHRVELFDVVQGTSVVAFSPDVLPLDGRTLRPSHFENIWRVFGFPGLPLPSPLHSRPLNELADGRNLVAHGNDDPVVFGKSKATSDVVKLVGRIDEISTHLAVSIEAYLASQGFAR